MSVHASEVPSTTGLDAFYEPVRCSPAGMATRSRSTSGLPGALAACVTGAGMADCSELIKLELSGSPETLRALSLQLTGTALAAGGAVAAGGAWWCGEPATPAAPAWRGRPTWGG